MSKSKAKPKAQRRQSERQQSEDSTARRQKIAEAAYYRAEGRGFAPGEEEADWLEAEKELDGGERQA